MTRSVWEKIEIEVYDGEKRVGRAELDVDNGVVKSIYVGVGSIQQLTCYYDSDDAFTSDWCFNVALDWLKWLVEHYNSKARIYRSIREVEQLW